MSAMKSSRNSHHSFPDLAARAHLLALTIYRLIAIFSGTYCFVLLVSIALADRSVADMVAATQGSQQRGIAHMLFALFLAATLFILLFRVMNHWLFVFVGLTLFAAVGPFDAFGVAARVVALLPFCGYFWMRAKSEPPLRSIALLVASIIVLQFVRLNFDGLPGSAVSISRHVTVWAAWSWTLVGSVFAVNLALGRWHARKVSTPERLNVATELQIVSPAGLMPPTQTATTPVPKLEPASELHPLAAINNVAIRARYNFAAVIGMEPIKTRLIDAGRDAMIGFGSTNGILLFGQPGNGKTFLAEVLAGELNLPMISVNFGTVASRFVNETTQQVMQVFADAVRQAPCILFIDEVEALLSDRSSTADGAGEYSRTTSALLAQIVDIRSKGVVLVAATNYMNRLDSAATREGRFDTKIEITAPDDVARQALIRRSVFEAADHFVWPTGETVASLSRHWAGFSVSRIRAAARLAGRRASERGVEDVPIAMFQSALREVQGSFGDYVPSEVRGLETLHFDGEVGQRLTDLAQEMRETFAFEQHGGRMASGVLFYGPPGTGKTIAAKALAKSAAWALINANGTELAQHPDRIQSLLQRAIDLKPCVVFIDEADALISDRTHSWSAAATNVLLSETGDDRDSLRDVLLIAATNHPDGVDAAVLRGGRFGEQLAFTLPTKASILSFLRAELGTRSVDITPDVLENASAVLVGQSLANVKSALDRACNSAARRTMRHRANAVNAGRSHLLMGDF